MKLPLTAALFTIAVSSAATGQTPACTSPESSSTEIEFAAGRKGVVWRPAGWQTCGRLPLVVFSHGINGCATQTLFFTEELARRGYLVAAPDHLDANCGARPPQEPEQPFSQPENWSEETYRNRRDDLRAVLDFLLDHPVFGPHIDITRIGGAGHSLGGYSMMAVAGAWPGWSDPRYRAMLLFSPYAAPLLDRGGVGQMRVPVMYQGGSRDPGITPLLRKEGGVYESANPVKYYVEFHAAGHLAWTNSSCDAYASAEECAASDRTAKLINQYALAFLDQHLRDERQPLLASPRHPQVADFRADAR